MNKLVKKQWKLYRYKKRKIRKSTQIFSGIAEAAEVAEAEEEKELFENAEEDNRIPHDKVKELSKKWKANIDFMTISKKHRDPSLPKKDFFLSTIKLESQLDIISAIRSGNFIVQDD